MAFGSGDFRQLDIIQASDFSRVYDVEPVTSGFGDFSGSTQQMKHRVQSGENLRTISARYYGTSTKYMDIFNANRALVSLRGPDYLQVGWELVIPAVPIPQAAKVEVAQMAQQAALEVKAQASSPSIFQNKKLLFAGAALLVLAYLMTRKKSPLLSNPSSTPSIYSKMSLQEIGHLIKRNWTKPYFGAVPYIDAMTQLDEDGNYFHDDWKTIVIYFLANAQTWRGDVARAIKKELKRRHESNKMI